MEIGAIVGVIAITVMALIAVFAGVIAAISAVVGFMKNEDLDQ